MMLQFAIMSLTGLIDSGVEQLTEDSGKTLDELYEIMKGVHAKMNDVGRTALEEAGFPFNDETANDDGKWRGIGAGMLSMIYMLHARQMIDLYAQQMGETGVFDGEGPAN